MRYDEEREPADEQPDPAVADEGGAEGATGLVGFVGGLVLGALIGAGIALLVAPERGRVMRRRLARHLRDTGDEIRDEFDGLRAAARRSLSRRRRRMRRLGRAVS